MPVLKPLAFVKEGRSSPCFRLSWGRLIGTDSRGESVGAGDVAGIRDVSVGVRSGVGDCSWTGNGQNGILCGSGDMSMSMSIESIAPGEEDGIGGVVRFPSPCQPREFRNLAGVLLTVTVMCE
jgi:hypothetical protein